LLGAEEARPSWKDHARLKVLHQTDLLLDWGFGQAKKPLQAPSLAKTTAFHVEWPELVLFAKEHGYFSLMRPLVATVSSFAQDIELVMRLLETAPAARGDVQALEIAIAEVLSKVLAYRDLPLGFTLNLPLVTKQGIILEPFTVDRVFNLWHGMPAFGLIPQRKGLSSLLLFRGTDFSLITKRGLASVLSDLDLKSPGFHAFSHSKQAIDQWLKEVHSQGKSARVMGFSLGGALACYTFVYSHHLLAQEPSLAMCPIGVSSTVSEYFYTLSAERRAQWLTYVSSGDLVSRMGCLLGSIYTLSVPEHLKPLSAHTSLLSAAPLVYTVYQKMGGRE
jgi:hypothetical protein